MRKVLKAIGLICCLAAISLAVSGCSGKSEEIKNELRIALPDDVRGFDPSTSGYTSGIWDVYSLLYDRLVIEDRNKQVVAQLAKSWEVSDDGLTWTFHLREDVEFTSGTKFNAAAVKASFEFLKGKSICPVPLTTKIKSIEVADDYTVKFVLNRPHAPFLADLTDMRYPILAVNDGQPVGTGPYILKEWIKGKEIVLVKNERYWKGVPIIDRIVFKIIPDPHTRSLALEAGEIDLITCYGSPNLKEELQRLQKNPQTVVDTIHNWKVGHHLVFNYKKGPFSDARARKAVSYAIDAQKVKENIVGKYGITGVAHLSPLSPFAKPDIKGYACNLEQAKNYLSEAGWKDSNNDGALDKNGKPFRVKLVITKDDIAAIAEMAQSQLQKVGVEVEIQVLERGAQQKAIEEGNFDLALFTRIYCSGADPHLHFRQIYRSGADERYGYIFKNNELDDLINKLYTTLDNQERVKVYQRIQEVLLENAAAVYLFYEDHVTLYNRRLKNFDPFSGELSTLWQAYLEK
ncbi:MAG: hypothetical protein C4554_04325 [Dethiobacter sp.]|jgi:peptide/nickel transport system substrate-binding protein|nr:MAG: hypothetical protein C4554_04325 [Dethiobacter sp.]